MLGVEEPPGQCRGAGRAANKQAAPLQLTAHPAIPGSELPPRWCGSPTSIICLALQGCREMRVSHGCREKTETSSVSGIIVGVKEPLRIHREIHTIYGGGGHREKGGDSVILSRVNTLLSPLEPVYNSKGLTPFRTAQLYSQCIIH